MSPLSFSSEATIETKAFEHVILGCGVAGLCAAKMLIDAGVTSLLVIDEYKDAGGNQISHEINGYTFDIGAFYYWPTMPLFKMYPEILAECPARTICIERIQPNGEVGPFPFSLRREFIDRGPLYWLRSLSSMGLARLRPRHFVTARDYAIFWMGRTLYIDLGMDDYIRRFFGLSAVQIEAQFAISRMALIPRYGKPSFWLRKCYDRLKRALSEHRNSPAEILLVRPEKGLAHMYGSAVSRLIGLGVDVRLNQKIDGITKQFGQFEISAGGCIIRTANLINTIPIKSISRFFDVAPSRDLECVDLATLFVSFNGNRSFKGSILYNWGRFGRWKRLTMHSDYYGRRNEREYASVEVPLFRCKDPNFEELFADFVGSAETYEIFLGDLRLEGHKLVESAYPAYTLGTSSKVTQAVKQLDALGIQSVGRQGRFDYLPTGEHVAKQVAEKLKL